MIYNIQNQTYAMLTFSRRLLVIFLINLSFVSSAFSELHLEDCVPDFVLATKRIYLPENPFAFNASIIRWRGRLLMSFRDIPDPSQASLLSCAADSVIGLVWLDEDFNPVEAPCILPLDQPHWIAQPTRSEDPRLITVGDHLYLIYSDNKEEEVTDGGFRVFVAELDYDGKDFCILHNERLCEFEGQKGEKREKNWVPFDYQGQLHLAYGIIPHRILKPSLDGSGRCVNSCSSVGSIVWEWGELRGGTPAVLIDDHHYLSFFHSSLDLTTIYSKGKPSLHYFMGAYLFSNQPPFEITSISPEPIVGKNFYHGKTYIPYWKPVQVVFPCGIFVDEHFIFISYGRQDHETWVVKLDKQGLLESLINVSNLRVNEDSKAF